MLSKYKNALTFSHFFLFGLFALFCIIMVLPSPNIGGSGFQLPYNIFMWLGLVILLVLSLLHSLWRGFIYFNTYSLVVAAIFIAFVLPFLYVDKLFIDVEQYRYYGLLFCFVFFFVLSQYVVSKQHKNIILAIILLSVVLQAVWGALQTFYFDQVFRYNPVLHKKPFGILQQYNDYGTYMLVGLSIMLYFMPRVPVIIKWLFISLCIGLIVLLFKANAESSLLIGLCILPLNAMLYWNKDRFVSWVSLGSFIFFVLLLSSHFLPSPSTPETKTIVSNVESSKTPANSEIVNSVILPVDKNEVSFEPSTEVASNTPWVLRSKALGTRPMMYLTSLVMIKDNFWQGVGIGLFKREFLLTQGELLKIYPDANAQFNLDHPHNEILFWMAENGVVGVLPFLILFFAFVYFYKRDCLDLKIFMVAVPVILHSMLELPMYHSVAHLLIFLIVMYIAVDLPNKKIQIKFNKLAFIFITPAVLYGSFIIFMFLLSSLYALQNVIQFNRTDRQVVGYLANIENQAAFKNRIEFEFFNWKLQRARERGEITLNELNQLLIWSYSVLQYNPMPSIYKNFIDALIMGKKFDIAQQYLDEANLMFPKADEFKDLQDKIISRRNENL